jgi:hypothetical protein
MSLGTLTQPRQRLFTVRLFHAYLWLVMAGLLVQGSGSLVFDLFPALAANLPVPLTTLMNGNQPHAVLHIVWGIIGLFSLAAYQTHAAYLRLGWVFGVFYTLLGFLGIIAYHPFGMRLELPENAFHLTVGPLMLLLAFLAWRSRAHPLHAFKGAHE